MLHNYAKASFADSKNHQDDLLMICCVDKTLVGWHTERSVATMRERCGGQGFLAANMFGEAIGACHAAITAEGDNKVLMIKVVKDMLSLYMKKPDYFYSGEPVCLKEKSDLTCLKKLSQLFEWREKRNL
jgi:acyl-CoA oxidase